MFHYRFIIFSVTCACLISVSLIGCASHQKQKSLNAFDERIRLYGRLLRWKEYEAAVNMIRHQDESPADVNLEYYDDLRVVDYEIKKVAMNEDHKSAIVDAEISFYYESRNTVMTIRDTQNWWYMEEAESWFLDGSLPSF